MFHKNIFSRFAEFVENAAAIENSYNEIFLVLKDSLRSIGDRLVYNNKVFKNCEAAEWMRPRCTIIRRGRIFSGIIS